MENKPTIHDVSIYESPFTLFQEAALRVAEVLRETLQQQPVAYLALAGGGTPRYLYQALCRLPRDKSPNWQAVQFYFGDERAVAPNDPEANFRMANENLFIPLMIKPAQIHRIHAELPAAQAIADYRAQLQQLPQHNGLPRFDLILLGMGNDGHIASLFPGSELLQERVVGFSGAEVATLGTYRYSLTLPTLDNARHLMLLVIGEAKAEIIQRVFTTTDPEGLPVQQLHHERLEWFMDADAAQALPEEAAVT